MKQQVRLWLDDIRDPRKFGHDGWLWVKTYDEAIAAFRQYEVIRASLDHDLSIFGTVGVVDDEKTGYDLVCWMEEHRVFPAEGVHIHSANPAGAKRMHDGLRALCRRIGTDERLVTVWPADAGRSPHDGEDPFDVQYHDPYWF